MTQCPLPYLWYFALADNIEHDTLETEAAPAASHQNQAMGQHNLPPL
jgi:hypothetical protein